MRQHTSRDEQPQVAQSLQNGECRYLHVSCRAAQVPRRVCHVSTISSGEAPTTNCYFRTRRLNPAVMRGLVALPWLISPWHKRAAASFHHASGVSVHRVHLSWWRLVPSRCPAQAPEWHMRYDQADSVLLSTMAAMAYTCNIPHTDLRHASHEGQVMGRQAGPSSTLTCAPLSKAKVLVSRPKVHCCTCTLARLDRK
jgi:hypothetical protein